MNLKQQSFITEYLRTGDKIIAYRIVYQPDSTNYRSLESAANRLLQNPEVATTISHVQDKIRYEVEQELKAEMKRELLTVQRKRELLYQIATGELAVEQHYKGKNCSQCTQYVKPTINQMLKAIDLDNKLAGHYGNKVTSPLERGVGVCLLAQDNKYTLHPDSYRDATKNESPLQGDRGKHSAIDSKVPISQQNTTNTMSPAGGGGPARDGGGTLRSTAIQNTSPLQGIGGNHQPTEHSKPTILQQNTTFHNKSLYNSLRGSPQGA